MGLEALYQTHGVHARACVCVCAFFWGVGWRGYLVWSDSNEELGAHRCNAFEEPGPHATFGQFVDTRHLNIRAVSCRTDNVVLGETEQTPDT